jgi:hypothetical protein
MNITVLSNEEKGVTSGLGDDSHPRICRLSSGWETTRTAEKANDDDDDPTAVIAQAMNHLSVQQLEQAYEDTHGVSAMVRETPELIAETLNRMELCLEKIHHKPAYDLAVTIRADYVRDPKLRLMFFGPIDSIPNWRQAD